MRAKLGGGLPVSIFVVTAMQTIYKYDWNLTKQTGYLAALGLLESMYLWN